MKIKVLCARSPHGVSSVHAATTEEEYDQGAFEVEAEVLNRIGFQSRVATVIVPDDFLDRVFAEVEVEGRIEP